MYVNDSVPDSNEVTKMTVEKIIGIDVELDELCDEIGIHEHNEDTDESVIEEIDPFAVLNVPENSSSSVIRSRFHRLSLAMHPDRTGAALAFPLVADAHSLIQDKDSRQAYLSLGINGVNETNDCVKNSHRLFSSSAIREYVASTAINNELDRLASIAPLRCRSDLHLDTLKGVNRFISSFHNSMRIGSNIFVLGAQYAEIMAATRNRRNSLLFCKITRSLSRHILAVLSLQSSRSIEVQLWRRFNEHSKGGLVASLSKFGPGLTLSSEHNLSRFSCVNVSWILGPVPGVLLSLDNGDAVVPGEISKSMQIQMHCRLGTDEPGVEVNSRYDLNKDNTAYAKMQATLVDLTFELRIERTLLHSASSISYGIVMDVLNGVSFFVRVQRSSLSFNLPVVCHDKRLLLLCLVVPTVISLGYNWLMLQLTKRQLSAHGKTFMRNKEIAFQQQKSLNSLANYKRQSEEAINGLVIVEALYGVLPASYTFSSNEHEEEIMMADNNLSSTVNSVLPAYIDVVTPLQAFVSRIGSRIYLPSTSKGHACGFFDSSSVNDARLLVRYRFRQTLHQCCIYDDESLRLPDPTHIITT